MNFTVDGIEYRVEVMNGYRTFTRRDGRLMTGADFVNVMPWQSIPFVYSSPSTTNSDVQHGMAHSDVQHEMAHTIPALGPAPPRTTAPTISSNTWLLLGGILLLVLIKR